MQRGLPFGGAALPMPVEPAAGGGAAQTTSGWWWTCGAATSACSTALGLGGTLAFGGWLVALSAQHANAACPVPLALWARVQGALALTAGGLGILAAVATLASLRAASVPALLTSTGCVVSAATLTSLATLGVLIWGLVLAFGHDLWQRQHTPGGSPPCVPELYNPTSIALIVIATLAAVSLVGSLLLRCCCWCCCAPAPAAAKGDEDAADREERSTWMRMMAPAFPLHDSETGGGGGGGGWGRGAHGEA